MSDGKKTLNDQKSNRSKPQGGRPRAIDDVRAEFLYAQGMTDEELMCALGVSLWTITRWRKARSLPAYRLPARRRTGTSIRADRRDTVDRVVSALIEAPLASTRELAALGWPEVAPWAQGDLSGVYPFGRQVPGRPKKGGAAAERVRQAPKDLEQSPALAGDRAVMVIAILAGRALVKQNRQRVRSVEKVAAAARRAEAERRREERLRRGPVRYLMQRVAYYGEAVAAMKEAAREIIANGSPDEGLLYSLPGSKDQVPGDSPVPHFSPGPAGKVMTAMEARWRSEMEVAVQQKAANLAAVPPGAAVEILREARKLRQTRR